MSDVKTLIIDLETIPDLTLVDILPEPKADTRLKDPEKIAANIAMKAEKQKKEMGLDPLTNIICCAGFADLDGNTNHIILESEESEKKLLNNFWDICSDYDHFVSFNGRQFDMRCLYIHSMRHNISPSIAINSSKYNRGNHTDLRPVLSGEGAFAKGKLDTYAKLFLDRGKTVGINGEDVWEYWLMGDKEFIGQYCEEDCEITRDLYLMAQKSGLIEALK